MPAYLREHKEHPRSFLRSATLSISIAALACAAVLYFRSHDAAITSPRHDPVIVFTASPLDIENAPLIHAIASSRASSMRERGAYVTLVDCGGAAGGDLGAILGGEIAMQVIDGYGYDVIVPSANELALGLHRRDTSADLRRERYICTAPLPGGPSAVKIIDHGDRRIALVGVVPPDALEAISPSRLAHAPASPDIAPDDFFDMLTEIAKGARSNGADFAAALVSTPCKDGSPYSPAEIARRTHGFDAIVCASETETASSFAKNAIGKLIVISSCAPSTSFGMLVFTDSGVYASMISCDDASTWPNADIDADSTHAQTKAMLTSSIAGSDREISGYNLLSGKNARADEVPIGLLCADAVRDATGADAAIVDGGRVARGLQAGEITYADIIAIRSPSANVRVARVSGNTILQALEYGVRNAERYAPREGRLSAECAQFPQVSGLAFTVDTSVRSPVLTTPSGGFVRMAGRPRVSNVKIMDKSGGYIELVPEDEYTVAFSDGAGFSMLESEAGSKAMSEFQAIATYVGSTLAGDLTRYADPDKRIEKR